MGQLVRRVGVNLVVDVHQPARLVFQVAPADPAPGQSIESLVMEHETGPPTAREVSTGAGGRAHVVDVRPGRLVVRYQATVTGRSAPQQTCPLDEIVYLRPSRYAESDRLAAIALAEFAGVTGRAELLAAVSSWVGSRLQYVPGSSGPTDGAVDTLLLRRGVCRDYAHLVVALLRALDVPARLVAVYAPGLGPMDFHAVAEAIVGDDWWVVDATLLAPRSSLLRIATGRDAADTAFLSSYGGSVDLLESEVTAVVDGVLPSDDVSALVALS